MERTIFDVLEEAKVDASRAAFDYADRIKGKDAYMDEINAKQRDVFALRKRTIATIMRELPAEVLERVAE